MKKTPTNPLKNDWFTRTDAMYSEQAASSGEMGSVLEKIKEQQQSLTKYTGVVSMQYSSHGNSFYDEDEDDEMDSHYKCSDPFSKLKYDDLRKVHKDQTVFSVRESDLRNMRTYKTVKEFEEAREASGTLAPMERSKAQQMLQEQDSFLQEKILHKQYQSELVTMRNMDANKQVMSNFLRLN
jgi:hypothetical protein